MVRWICGVPLMSGTASAELYSRLGIECITAAVRVDSGGTVTWSKRIMMFEFQHVDVLKLKE